MRKPSPVALVCSVMGVAVSGWSQTCGWEWVNPLPQRRDLYRAASNSTVALAVGADGSILSTTDGQRWISRQSGVEADLWGIKRGSGRWVAVGDGVIVASSQAVEWELRWSDPGVRLVDLEFSASRFLAVASSGLAAQYLVSSDGLTWETVSAPWSGDAESVTSTGTGFLVLAGDELWISGDGLGWEQLGELPSAKAVGDGPAQLELGVRRDVAWDGHRAYVARGTDVLVQDDEGFHIALSLESTCAMWSSFVALHAEASRIVASAYQACPIFLKPDAHLYLSTDEGATWDLTWAAEGGGFPGLTRSGSTLIGVGSAGDVVVGSNGSSWTCPGGGCTSGACLDGFTGLASAQGRTMAVGGVTPCVTAVKRVRGATLATSNDSVSFAVREAPDLENVVDIATDGELFVSVGSGWVGVVTGGDDWDDVSWTTTPDFLAVAWVGDRFVAVGKDGALFHSADGREWQGALSTVATDLLGATFADGRPWLFGREGVLLTSTDFVLWTPVAVPMTNDLRSATAALGGMVIVGDGDTLLIRDSNGHWSMPFIGLPPGVDLADVVATDDMVVAVGGVDGSDMGEGAIVTASMDGHSWTTWRPRAGRLDQIVWTGSAFIAAGADRALLRSECLGDLVVASPREPIIDRGDSESFVLTIGRPAPSSARIKLRSSAPDRVSVPGEVVMPAGSSSVAVPVSAIADGDVVAITATLPAILGGGETVVPIRVSSPNGVRRSGRRVGP